MTNRERAEALLEIEKKIDYIEGTAHYVHGYFDTVIGDQRQLSVNGVTTQILRLRHVSSNLNSLMHDLNTLRTELIKDVDKEASEAWRTKE